MPPYKPTGKKRGRPRDPNKVRPRRPGPPPAALRAKRDPVFEEMRQQMDAVVAAIHPGGRPDVSNAVVGDGLSAMKTSSTAATNAVTNAATARKETLADRVEKVVGIVMSEEEKARVEKERREAAMYWPVCINKKRAPKGSEVSDDRMVFTSSKGYRTAVASHGVSVGAFYFEVKVEALGETGHARLGWMSKKGEVNAPVGFDGRGYGYKDIRGEKVHEGVTSEYGEAFGEGDVIGCYVYIDETKREEKEEDATTTTTTSANSSYVAFAKNGVFQGKAFEGLNADDGEYFPCGSLFTMPNVEPAKLVFNFGPDFAHPPNATEWGVSPPRPMSDLDPPRPPPEVKEEPVEEPAKEEVVEGIESKPPNDDERS
jgi:Set1/Ash2 histone methyltransferase complex subunit ASH2